LGNLGRAFVFVYRSGPIGGGDLAGSAPWLVTGRWKTIGSQGCAPPASKEIRLSRSIGGAEIQAHVSHIPPRPMRRLFRSTLCWNMIEANLINFRAAPEGLSTTEAGIASHLARPCGAFTEYVTHPGPAFKIWYSRDERIQR
jgi:hypothetical protein